MSASAETTPTSLISGVSPVFAAPFHDDGRLDEASFGRVADHIVASGARTALLFGLATEFPKLTDDERDRLLAIAVGRARGSRLSIIASVTDHSTEVAVVRARRYIEAGARLINIFPPHFLSPSRAQILDHIASIADGAGVPVVIQYAPNESGSSISCADIASLLDTHAAIAAVKVEAMPPGPAIDSLLNSAKRRPSVLVGYAGLHWPEALAHGANGVQPGCSFAELYVHAQHRLDAQDRAGFALAHSQLAPYLRDWMTGVERIVAMEKTILWRRGVIASPRCRRPFHTLSADDHAAISRFLTEFGLTGPAVNALAG